MNRSNQIAKDVVANLTAEWMEIVQGSEHCAGCKNDATWTDRGGEQHFVCSANSSIECPVIQDHCDALIADLAVAVREVDFSHIVNRFGDTYISV